MVMGIHLYIFILQTRMFYFIYITLRNFNVLSLYEYFTGFFLVKPSIRLFYFPNHYYL